MCLLMEKMKNNEKEKMKLELSTDAKPRLKWTYELHQRFIESVNQLGGPNKATPKGLMKVMEIPGLTLYHLKSHLQKYRLGKSQKLDEEENQETESKKEVNFNIREETKESGIQITEALQIQMEVQKKLHEQIEVQRHLQMKIEAQGKYLQSVLMKAQETLGLASMVNRYYPSSSISELTQVEEEEDEGFLKMEAVKQLRSSVESSLTSSENSEIKFGENNYEKRSMELPLMEIKPEVKKRRLNDDVLVEQKQSLVEKEFGVGDYSHHLRLTLSTYDKDMDTCPNIELGLNYIK